MTLQLSNYVFRYSAIEEYSASASPKHVPSSTGSNGAIDNFKLET